MKLVLLSGGSGKRLWPLSNDTRSKQFLQVLENNEGQNQSMVQRVWGQLEVAGLAESTVIATSKMQREMIRMQIGTDVPLVLEPVRRDTFPAIALAATYLYSVEQVSLEEVVAILPVDPYVESSFFHKVRELEDVLVETNADLALIGVKPTYPSEKYGYIVPVETNEFNQSCSVERFVEKPSEKNAIQLINQKALWNCGVFAFKLEYIIRLLQKKNLPTNFNDLSQIYLDLPKISFDYEVVEKAENIVVLPYEGPWKDLGTWNTLTEEMNVSKLGKGIIDNSCKNTHLINELDVPITAIGMKDVVIAASADGILVSDKAASPKIKEIMKGIDQPVMYEERLWGWSRILDWAKFHNKREMVARRICIHKGKNSTYHYHNFRDEVWTIVRGEGELAIDDRISRVKAGDIVNIPIGRKHAIRAITELEFIEVQTGDEISDDDFIRLYQDWEDILEQFEMSKATVIV